ncbi:MAG TPA: hypothetical protein ENK80_04705 [Rhodobacterales bacterium]|nr:hypothetical protein [Rhodobacterales bacterium]
MRLVSAALTLTALLLPLAAPAGPFDGRYRPNYDWAESWDCRSAGAPGGALMISGDTYLAPGANCTLSDPVEVRDMTAVLYDIACDGPDGPERQRVMILAHAFGIYVIAEGLVLDWLRCD